MGRQRLVWRASWWAAAWTVVFAAAEPKRLVFFAGPHKAASKSVEKFFHLHASGYGGAAIAQGLEGWLWPAVEEDLWINGHPIEPQEVFNLLVSESSNATAQRILRTSIRDAWDASEFGVILGTPEFDRVGQTPFTKQNGLEAMKAVVYHLRLSPDDVTVVLNYRTPRRDQWISLWKHLERMAPYGYWLCNGNRDEQLEVLDTALNPLKLAEAYRKEYWKVALIDMGGVEEEELDVSHVLACEVLSHTTCDGGFVVPIMETYKENAKEVKEEFVHAPSDADQEEIEKLFRERDCFYRDQLFDDTDFQVLHNASLWKHCYTDEKSEGLYSNYTDPNNLLDAMKSQRNCSGTGTSVPDLLVGDYSSSFLPTETESRRKGPSIMVVFLGLLTAIGIGFHQVKRRTTGAAMVGHFEMRNMPRGIGSYGNRPPPRVERVGTQIGEWI